MVCASEDVGNADPMAMVMASACAQAVERIGMPEGRIVLSQTAEYIACAPKSDASTAAIDGAMEEVQESGSLPIPPHLQDAHYKSAGKLGHGVGYKYAHDYKNDYVKQQYLPYELSGHEFYRPSNNGYEVKIREHMKKIRDEASDNPENDRIEKHDENRF